MPLYQGLREIYNDRLKQYQDKLKLNNDIVKRYTDKLKRYNDINILIVSVYYYIIDYRKEEINLKDEVLNKPNQLINLIPENDITITERKAYNIMLKNAQNKLKFDQYQGNTFKISRYELHKKANLKNDDNKYIYNQLENLMRTVVRIFREKDNKKEWKKSFTLLSSIERTADDCYEFELNNHIINALKEQTFFTPLDLMIINSLSSQYEIIFYELAIEYKKYKIPKMSVEEVRKLTNTQNSYKQFYDFRKRVLDRACKEISEKTDIRLSYETEKQGRKIAYIDFQIEKKAEEVPAEIEVNAQEETEYSTEVLELFELLPEEERVETNKEELAHLLDKHSFKYLKKDIKYTKDSNPENFMAFLKASCNNGHYASAQIEKEEKKEKLAQKRAEEEKRREEVKKKIQQKAHEKAVEKYAELSDEELDSYADNYDSLPNILKKRVSRKDYIIGALEDEFEEELKELAAGIF